VCYRINRPRNTENPSPVMSRRLARIMHEMNSFGGSLYAFCATHPLGNQAEDGNGRYEEHQIVKGIARVPARAFSLAICPPSDISATYSFSSASVRASTKSRLKLGNAITNELMGTALINRCFGIGGVKQGMFIPWWKGLSAAKGGRVSGLAFREAEFSCLKVPNDSDLPPRLSPSPAERRRVLTPCTQSAVGSDWLQTVLPFTKVLLPYSSPAEARLESLPMLRSKPWLSIG
jgi:hypothetical protein